MEETTIRECTTIEEFDGCVALQREAFGLPDLELSPRRHLIVSRQAGGWTLGAFVADRMVGFVHHLAAVRGDEVFACVVSEGAPPDATARQQIAADIVAWSLSRLAYYKAPGYVAFVAAVPLTSTQKIQRGALKELVATTIGSEVCVDTRSAQRR